MRRKHISTLVATGAFLLLGSISTLTAQTPGSTGAPGGGGMAPQQSTPSTRPDVNAPMDQQQGSGAASQKVDDKKFVKDAALGGMTEVELGKLAQQKASSSEVKQFGQKMVDDHTKANDELKQVASQESIDIPASLDPKHQSRIDKLAKLEGAAFDKAYVKDQLKDHQTDVKDFNSEAQNGSDPKVKAFASTTLPTLQQHLEMVKNLSKTSKETGKDSKGQ